MSIEAVNPSVNYQPVKQNKKGGGGKAIASAFIPGLGQFCDGRAKAGALYLGGVTAASLGGRMLSASYLNNLIQTTEKTGEALVKSGGRGKLYGAITLGIAATSLYIANIVDAYKGGKQKAEA